MFHLFDQDNLRIDLQIVCKMYSLLNLQNL